MVPEISSQTDRPTDRRSLGLLNTVLRITKNNNLKGCSTVQKIVIEIVIEIYMEQTQLFQYNRFHCADFRD